MSAHRTTGSSRTDAESTENEPRPMDADARLRWGVYAILLTGVAFVVHGIGFVYRTYFTDGFELGVAELDGVTSTELAATHPEVASYVDHVQVSFGGLMIAVGLGIAALAWYGVRRGQRWALATAVGVPGVFAAFSLPVHTTVGFDFHFLLHLGPAGVGMAVLLVGAVLAALGMRATEPASTSTGGDR